MTAEPRTIRVAAVGDVHVGEDSGDMWHGRFAAVADDADVLLLAGDLTQGGLESEARLLAEALRPVTIPRIAVLGNHDHHAEQPAAVRRVLEDAGIEVLEGAATTVEVAGVRIGIAGTKGFGGGFIGACGSDFGEPEMKAFIRHTRALADRLETALGSLVADHRIALLHYAPVPDTLQGERLEIYPFLGSYLLAEAIDRAGADLVIHGHAHAGVERGITPGGVRVRNVALPVIKHTYQLYCFGNGDAECRSHSALHEQVLLHTGVE
jgi:Icc-related predicted phosphoesterase